MVTWLMSFISRVVGADVQFPMGSACDYFFFIHARAGGSLICFKYGFERFKVAGPLHGDDDIVCIRDGEWNVAVRSGLYIGQSFLQDA
jgi:hypothetical protein